jgi:predicted nucleotidyltransferase
VDVLVEFAPQSQVTLLDMVRMEDELSEIIGRRVDLRTKGFLSRYFRDDVVAEAEVEFVA